MFYRVYKRCETKVFLLDEDVSREQQNMQPYYQVESLVSSVNIYRVQNSTVFYRNLSIAIQCTASGLRNEVLFYVAK